MEFMFEIEDAMTEADVLQSLLLALIDSAYGCGGYTFNTYEAAFSHVCLLASDHFKHLRELTDKAFALRDNERS